MKDYVTRAIRRCWSWGLLISCVACLAVSSLSCAAIAEELSGDRSESVQIDSDHRLLSEQIVAGHGVEIGAEVGSLWFHDVTGAAHYLDDLRQDGPVAFVFLSTKCPLAKRYTQRLNRLHEKYSPSGLTLVGVFPNSDDSLDAVVQYSQAAEYPFMVVKDHHGYLARRLGATMTPQVLLVDTNGQLRYRGGVDDNRYEDRVRQHYVADALAALLSSSEIAQTQSSTLGCTIHVDEPAGDGDVTYSSHIARVFQDNCQTCHRDGQVAPFSLTNYDEARTWAEEIRNYTHARLMPPWKPSPGYGDFKEARYLTDEQIEWISAWVDAGMPEGNSEELPPPARFNDDWALGEPDFIVEMPEEYRVGPEGEDDYRHFVIPIDLPEDRYVAAIDVQPGNRSTVHHVIVYADNSGKARELDAADPGLGYTRFGGVGFDPVTMLGGWAPGQMPTRLPPGTGRWLPKKCDVVMQVHYYRTGLWESDRTRVGLYFSKAPKPVPAHYGLAINTDFTIPPGASNYQVEAGLRDGVLKEPVYVVSVYPHMHLLGKDIKVTATLPDGKEVPFVWIKDWDFSWQSPYEFTQLQYLPAGSRIQVVSHFDNSADNPNNPHDPPKPVGWGEKTTDEMCIAFFTYLKASDYELIDAHAAASDSD